MDNERARAPAYVYVHVDKSDSRARAGAADSVLLLLRGFARSLARKQTPPARARPFVRRVSSFFFLFNAKAPISPAAMIARSRQREK